MSLRSRTPHRRSAAAAIAVAGALAALAAVPFSSSAEPSLGELNSELGQQQVRQQSLESSLGGLSEVISSLSGQIGLVQSREAAVQGELAVDRARLADDKAALAREQRLLAVLRARLARGRMLLARQLVSSYESDSPDLVTVLLDSNGFRDLLERITFLRDAEHQQQAIITFTRTAKARATAAARRLAELEVADRQTAEDAAVRAQALAGMNSLLQSKQSTLEQAQSVQRAALAASQTQSGQIRSQISQIEAQQAAERAAEEQAAQQQAAQQQAAQQQAAQQQAAQQQAAQQQAAQQQPSPVSSGGPVSAPVAGSGSWVIPSSIVQCESGGQNLPPNSAGASGYYQIVPGTWRQYGGSGSSAYGASRAEQNNVASRIWAGGSGASNWACAGMVGIH